jgi:hypothetical protein
MASLKEACRLAVAWLPERVNHAPRDFCFRWRGKRIMNRKTQTRLVTMMAACALVVNAAYMQSSRAQGMPDSARQLVDTMRPMYVAQDVPASGTAANDDSYGGAESGKSESSTDTRSQ